MRKIKYILATILSAFLVMLSIVVGGKVLAASEEFSANDLSTGSVSSGAKIYDGNLFDITNTGGGSAVVACEATSTDSAKTYSKVVYPGGTTGSSRGFTLTSGNSSISYTVYYTVSSGSWANNSSKDGDLIVGGTTYTISGKKSGSTAYIYSDGILAANSSVLLYSSSNRLSLFGIVAEEATVTTYSVTYMDGSTELKSETLASGATISYTPTKYGYDFEGWYTDSTLQTKIDSSYTVTANVTLYANWTAWTNTGIEEYTLSNAAIGKIATGIDGNLSDDLALTPSIYTAMSGVGMITTNVTLPGATSATQAPCFNTNGAVKTNGYGLKFTAPANGTLTAYVGAGGGSERNIKLTDGTDVLEPTTGSTVVGNIESARYTPVQIVYILEEGTTYYFGGDSGVRIYYISFVPTTSTADSANVAIEAQQSTDGTAVRFITTLTGVDAIDVTSWNVTLTYNGGSEVTTASFTTLYLAVKDTKDAIDGTYYLVFTVSEIPSEANGKVITAAMTVTFEDGSSLTTLIKEETILQIA